MERESHRHPGSGHRRLHTVPQPGTTLPKQSPGVPSGPPAGAGLPYPQRCFFLLSPENIISKQLHKVRLESKVTLLLTRRILGNKSHRICSAAKKTIGYLPGLLWMMKISSLNPSPLSVWTTR